MKILKVGPNEAYKTIQSAINTIPSIMTEDVIIQVYPGTYKEQVRVQNKTGHAIVIEGIGMEANPIFPDEKQPAVVLKQILAFDLQCLLRIKNIRFVWSDQIDNERGVIHFSRVSYGAVNDCFFDGKTRVNNITSLLFDGSNGSVSDCFFHGQYRCIYSLNAAQVMIRENRHSSTSSLEYIRSANAIAYDISKQNLGIKKEVESGKIF